MKIPNKIKVAGQLVNVLFKNLDEDEVETNSGYCNAYRNKIVINNSLPKTQQESTLIHETIEAINQIYELKLEHNQIMTLETSLYK